MRASALNAGGRWTTRACAGDHIHSHCWQKKKLHSDHQWRRRSSLSLTTGTAETLSWTGSKQWATSLQGLLCRRSVLALIHLVYTTVFHRLLTQITTRGLLAEVGSKLPSDDFNISKTIWSDLIWSAGVITTSKPTLVWGERIKNARESKQAVQPAVAQRENAMLKSGVGKLAGDHSMQSNCDSNCWLIPESVGRPLY